MADKKISALTGATTPLAGTEVLPIVQSGSTVKVSVANLTAGRAVSASSVAISAGAVGLVSSFSDGVAQGIVMATGSGYFGVYNPNFGNIAFRNGGNTSDTLHIAEAGNVTVGYGNLVIGTSGKGIDFSATAGTGTSELLADYEEGTWTPVLTPAAGSITTYTASGNYTKIGRQVNVNMNLSITVNGTGAGALLITGLPFVAATIRLDSGVGREYQITGNAVALTFSATNTLQMLTYNNLYPGGSGYLIAASIAYNA